MTNMRIGTAGWSIPRQDAAAAPGEGQHLHRYARILSAAEINSSFHRPHQPAVYARWAASVPDGFRFAVKLPREITHTRRLVDAAAPLDGFLRQAGVLGDRIGPLLVQLPPSLAFDLATAAPFFALLRERTAGPIACEPRHASWFAAEADALLFAAEVARVAADPAIVPAAAHPGGWPGLVYHRLHGAPRVYASAYEPTALAVLAGTLASSRAPERWCIFDNTAAGQAFGNALALRRLLTPAG